MVNNTYNSTFQDYPSIGQLKKAFESTGIVPIFIVFDNFADVLELNNMMSYRNAMEFLQRGYLVPAFALFSPSRPHIFHFSKYSKKANDKKTN